MSEIVLIVCRLYVTLTVAGLLLFSVIFTCTLIKRLVLILIKKLRKKKEKVDELDTFIVKERLYFSPLLMEIEHSEALILVSAILPFPELPPMDVLDCYKNSKIRKVWKDVMYYYVGDL